MRIPYSIRRSPLAVLVAALLLSHTHAAFLPVEHVRSLLPRAMKGYSIAALYDAVKEFLQDQDAWVGSTSFDPCDRDPPFSEVFG